MSRYDSSSWRSASSSSPARARSDWYSRLSSRANTRSCRCAASSWFRYRVAGSMLAPTPGMAAGRRRPGRAANTAWPDMRPPGGVGGTVGTPDLPGQERLEHTSGILSASGQLRDGNRLDPAGERAPLPPDPAGSRPLRGSLQQSCHARGSVPIATSQLAAQQIDHPLDSSPVGRHQLFLTAQQLDSPGQFGDVELRQPRDGLVRHQTLKPATVLAVRQVHADLGDGGEAPRTGVAEDPGQAAAQAGYATLAPGAFRSAQQLGTQDVDATLQHPAQVGDALLLGFGLAAAPPQVLQLEAIDVGGEPRLEHPVDTALSTWNSLDAHRFASPLCARGHRLARGPPSPE